MLQAALKHSKKAVSHLVCCSLHRLPDQGTHTTVPQKVLITSAPDSQLWYQQQQ